MSPSTEALALDDARNLMATDPRTASLPPVVTAFATYWGIGEPATCERLAELLASLATYLGAKGAAALTAVTSEMLEQWCLASGEQDRISPYERRAAVFTARSVLETCSAHQLGPDDLTIVLGRLSANRKRRPLLPMEHTAVRAAAHRVRCDAHRGSDNRIRRMAVALAEAGGTTNEVPQVTPVDIRRGNATVTFTGTRDTRRRNVALTPWGRTQILDVLDELDPEQPLAYRGHQRGRGGSPAASISGVAKRILADAGLVDGDVTLESLRNTGAVLAWNGRDIEPVLTVLGLTTRHAVQKAWDLVHWLDS